MGAYEITVTGLVQGIGFRAFVAEYAEKNGLIGSINNAGGIVKLNVECDEVEIGKLTYHLRYNCPEGGRVDNIVVKPVEEEVVEEETAKISAELLEVKEKMDAAENEVDDYMATRGWMAFAEKREKLHRDPFNDLEEKNKKEEQKKIIDENPTNVAGVVDENGETKEGVVLDEFGRELDDSFRIIKSENSVDALRFLPPDIATCDKCKEELLDPKNRRYRYPFISCSSCGPRYSIMKTVPYDRENSTMAGFMMCPDCAREYNEPANRRRFDQNIGCENCGPKLRYYENRLVDEVQMKQDEMLDKTIANLKAGKVGAIKSLGGFHFICLPTMSESIKKLRLFKDRENKPFSILFPDIESVKKYCYVSDKEEELLTSKARPIVILNKKETAEEFSDEVLKGRTSIGALLPFDPLQIILTHELGPLVITSGNKSGDPIIIQDMDMIMYLPRVDGGSFSDDAPSAVSFADDTIDENETTYTGHMINEDEICIDFMLTNTREILAPLDDSLVQVTKIHSGNTKRRYIQLIRRARGYVPQPIMLDAELPRPSFAAGTDFESSFALGQKNAVYLSEYYGNMTRSEIEEIRGKAITRMEDLLGINPKRFLGDLSPDYKSAKEADNRAMTVYIDGIPQRVQRRQHHAAHVLSVAAENGLTGRLLGIAYDGTGFGLDETIWGSEIFSCMLNDTLSPEEESDSTVETRPKILRSGALLPVKLMGGEQSSRDVKTTLCGYIRAVEERQLVGPSTIDKVLRILNIEKGDYAIISACLKADINIYYSACMGRLFDAVAALLGLKSKNTYGGECPIALEEAAKRAYRKDGVSLKDLELSDLKLKVIEPSNDEEIYRMDQATLMADLMEKLVAIYESGFSEEERNVEIDKLAFEFHKAIIDSTTYICDKVCGRDYIQHIALTGGTMYNKLLFDGIGSSLERLGYRVYTNSMVPCGDGGISLGQMYSEII